MRIQVSINFTRNNNAFTDWYDDSLPEEANVSDATNVTGTGSSGYKGFQFSQNIGEVTSALDGSCRLFSSEGYPGVLTRQLSESNEITRSNSYPFNPPITITFYLSQNTDNLYVVFDPLQKEYAVDFEIYNVESDDVISVYGNTQSIVKIPLESLNVTQGVTLSLFIYTWSKPYSSAKITRIAPFYTALYTGKDIEEVICSENVFDSQISIQPGLVEQYADISVYDRNNVLHQFAQQGELVEDCNVNISAIDDNNNGKSYLLGTYNVSEWNVHSNDIVVNTYCNDISSTFDQITVTSIPIKDRSVDDMLTLLFSYANGVAWRYIDSDTRKYCQNIITPNSWFYPGTLKELLNKICILGMIRIYWYSNAFIIARCW